MIQHYFIDHPKAIKVVQGSDASYPHELDDDMDLPNVKAIFDLTTTGTQMKDLSSTDFFKAKEKAIASGLTLDGLSGIHAGMSQSSTSMSIYR